MGKIQGVLEAEKVDQLADFNVEDFKKFEEGGSEVSRRETQGQEAGVRTSKPSPGSKRPSVWDWLPCRGPRLRRYME